MLQSEQERIDPNKVRFSQGSISYRFSRGGGTIDDLTAGLRTGRIRPEDVPPIRLVEREGQLLHLSHQIASAARGLVASWHAHPSR